MPAPGPPTTFAPFPVEREPKQPVFLNQIMKQLNAICLALLSGWLATACTTTEPDTNPTPGTLQKGYATGKATDTAGKPLANAEIVVNNTQLYNHNR